MHRKKNFGDDVAAAVAETMSDLHFDSVLDLDHFVQVLRRHCFDSDRLDIRSKAVLLLVDDCSSSSPDATTK